MSQLRIFKNANSKLHSGVSYLLTQGHSQQLILPKESKIYPDSIAIYWKKYSKALPAEVNIMIDSPYGDNYFKSNTIDTVVVAPYYLVYDGEAIIYIYLYDARKKRPKYLQQFAKLRPIKKIDAVELLIYQAIEKPDERNLVTLGQSFEQIECYINAVVYLSQAIPARI